MAMNLTNTDTGRKLSTNPEQNLRNSSSKFHNNVINRKRTFSNMTQDSDDPQINPLNDSRKRKSEDKVNRKSSRDSTTRRSLFKMNQRFSSVPKLSLGENVVDRLFQITTMNKDNVVANNKPQSDFDDDDNDDGEDEGEQEEEGSTDYSLLVSKVPNLSDIPQQLDKTRVSFANPQQENRKNSQILSRGKEDAISATIRRNGQRKSISIGQKYQASPPQNTTSNSGKKRHLDKDDKTKKNKKSEHDNSNDDDDGHGFSRGKVQQENSTLKLTKAISSQLKSRPEQLGLPKMNRRVQKRLNRIEEEKLMQKFVSTSYRQILYLVKNTHFDIEEVKALQYLYSFFLQSSRKGVIDRSAFRDIAVKYFGIFDDHMLDHMYNFFDSDHKGNVSNTEFVQNLSVVLRGSFEEQLNYCFECYDFSGDHEISRTEMATILRDGFVNIPTDDEDDLSDSNRELVELAMKKFDPEGTGVINFEKFRTACLRDPSLLQGFGPCLPVEKYLRTFMTLISDNYNEFSTSYSYQGNPTYSDSTYRKGSRSQSLYFNRRP